MKLGTVNGEPALIDSDSMEYAVLPGGKLRFLDAAGLGYVGAVDETGSVVKLAWFEISDDDIVHVEPLMRSQEAEHCSINPKVVHIR